MSYVDDTHGRSGAPPAGDLDLGDLDTAGREATRRAGRERSSGPGPEIEVAESSATRLAIGQTAVDVWRRRRLILVISGVLLVISGVALLTRGLDYSTEVDGGVAFDIPAGELSVDDARAILDDHGVDGSHARVEVRHSNNGDIVRVQVGELSADDRTALQEAFATAGGVGIGDVRMASVSASWTDEVVRTAWIGLAIAVPLVLVFDAIRYGWRIAVVVLITLAHNVVIAAGLYALFGFEVTLLTGVALLVVIGYTLYDTIVVFDRLKDNERRLTAAGMGSGDLVNVSTNQLLMRSVTAAVVTLLPVVVLILVSALVAGRATLRDFAVALVLGIGISAYASLFVATVLAGLFKRSRSRPAQLEGEDLRAVVMRGVGILSPVTARRRVGGPSARASRTAEPVGASTGTGTAAQGRSVDQSTEQLLGRAPRPRKKKKH